MAKQDLAKCVETGFKNLFELGQDADTVREFVNSSLPPGYVARVDRLSVTIFKDSDEEMVKPVKTFKIQIIVQ